MLSTHAERLERWLGKEGVAQIAEASMFTHAKVPIADVPGHVYAYRGDFIGPLRGGYYATLLDLYLDRVQRAARLAARMAGHPAVARSGFSSLNGVLAAASQNGGLQAPYFFSKVGVTGVANVANTLWNIGGYPSAGAAGGALSSGGSAAITQCTKSTAGALGPQIDPTGGAAAFLAGFSGAGSVAYNTLMLYDRIEHASIAMSSSSAQTITGGLGRYSGSTSSIGNMMWIEVLGVLAAVAHNHTILYTNSGGSTGQSTGAVAGVSSAIVNRVDHAGLAIPLASGDQGFTAITQYTCSANTVTGTNNLVAGHPLAFCPCPLAGIWTPQSAFIDVGIMQQVQSGACLGLMEVNKPSTTASTYQGVFTIISA